MINLIPNEEKKRKVKDFYFRLTTIFFIVLATAILVAVVALFPSYLLSAVKKNFTNTKLEMQKAEPIQSVDQKTLDLIKDLDNKLTLVEKAEQGKYVVSLKVVSEVILKKMSDIKITEITYENNPLLGRTIGIYGTSPNRERLLLFQQTLAGDPLFKKVDLPISNFIKGLNIQFYLTIISY